LGEAEFHFFMGGAGRVRNGDIETAYVPGSLFYTPAGVRHEAWGSKPTGFFFFRFVWEQADAELQSAVERRFANTGRMDIGFALVAEMETVRTRASDPDPLARRSAVHGLAALSWAMLSVRPGSTGPRDEQYVAEAKRLMRESAAASLNVSALAARLSLDPSYFIRLFKRSSGQPPLAYFLDLKMDTAKHLLLNSTRTIRSVAESLGFEDELYFSRLFKRRVGMPPGAYRKSASPP
jgi:AraC family transcriptional regulator of arabinose operon